MLKKLFFACAAILCLVLAYHFGATNAQGQRSPRPGWSDQHPKAVGISVTNNKIYVIDEIGDIWVRSGDHDSPWRLGNYWYAGTRLSLPQ